MFKKAIALFLAIVLFCTILTGCVDREQEESSQQASAIPPEQEEQIKGSKPQWDPSNPPLPTNPDGTRG